jgi:hypothetical protein
MDGAGQAPPASLPLLVAGPGPLRETDQMGIPIIATIRLVRSGADRFARRCFPTSRSRTAACGWSSSGVAIPAALRYDDIVLIHVGLSDVSARKVVFEYRLIRQADGELVATGQTVHIVTDPQGRASSLPEDILRLIQDAATRA